MAKAQFHSLRGEKSALVLVKANKFVMSADPVYIPKESIPEGISEGETFDIPDGYELIPMVGEDGEIRTTKEGNHPLKTLHY